MIGATKTKRGFPLRLPLRRSAFPTVCLLAVSLALTACAGFVPAPAPTATAAPPPTLTPTIVWFPPTRTPTPSPTPVVSPTIEARPGLGNLLFADRFDDPTLWATASGANAGAALNRERLTLTVRPKYRVVSLRAGPLLTDFYAETTVRLSLCRGADTYGLLFRAMSNADYYRFALNCQGQARAERVRGGELVPLSEWLPSGDAPPGAPGETRLGVWAAGAEMRFFLNGRYQFTVRDPVFRSGALGVFLAANGTTEATVSFSDLVVYAVAYVSPTPSATPSRTPRP